ncbi:Spo0E family sporulation regulatory protein-aspartic acid phosphatase [[Bacillus] enclensis]|uniref:Spo0E family sporulation regulatory protein-aspartic acid phosphatase n=1 Tax=[Bacillus] enclensis TaxID=1402860 RepID=UPI0018DCAC0F|nr:aspartyl-phosphate phosphatase Spo0E family protein [[Bacillus] enclensis]MBH9966610.1 aspartyl-phosphate phosphatase Spo0E family protein [[Bacillus] enclensis]
MQSTSQLDNILYDMEKKRAELQSFALVNGFTHPQTLKLSKELDELFNLYTEFKNTYT